MGNTASAADDARVEDSRRAVDAFLRDLMHTLPDAPARTTILLDGLRPQLYQGDEAEAAVAGSYFARMRAYLSSRASSLGFEVIDLNPRFRDAWRRHGQRFEFGNDFHWNARGHAVAAEALAQSPRLEASMRAVAAQ